MLQILLKPSGLNPDALDGKLTADQRQAIRDFDGMVREIEEAKKKIHASYARIQELEQQVAELKQKARRA